MSVEVIGMSVAVVESHQVLPDPLHVPAPSCAPSIPLFVSQTKVADFTTAGTIKANAAARIAREQRLLLARRSA
jgi:hypothetical protein